jgi:beta-glucosidase
MDIPTFLRDLTLEEKASLCSGRDFWTTKPVDRLGIPSIVLTDGPHGLRLQATSGELASLHESVPATCFPTGAALASSWDRSLLQAVGAAIGQEARAEGVAVLLGPAMNIKRSPLCGRNFEYLSEDPYLAGELAKHHVLGVQSQGVGSSLKHYAANNQERRRMTVDTVVDERTLREIYLPAFEKAVTEADPWTVMCAYNRLNGTYCSEHRWLLTQVLRTEWGHRGVVVTDWGACNDRVAGLEAGQDLEMPSSRGVTDADIVEAVRSGRLDVTVLDRAVERILRLTERATATPRPMGGYDRAAHHTLARRAAGECMVLLKNRGGLLPLATKGRIAFLGAFAEHPRYQGGGSSHIKPTMVDSALREARKLVGAAAEILYAPGYSETDGEPADALVREAADVARKADVSVVFIGLTDTAETEGLDRTHLDIPRSHTALLEAVRAAQGRVVVVLFNGAPVTMPWLDLADAVLEGYLGGQAGGGAVADVLFGRVNPSGKLAETFPARLEDTPCYLNFPGEPDRVEYREGLFVGYRHYDALGIEPTFPFGHGLSYTSFGYRDLCLDRTVVEEGETLGVSLRVSNTGPVAGKEVVQLYVQEAAPRVIRPVKELKSFHKVSLDPGQSQDVRFALDRRAFAHWDRRNRQWRADPGAFRILVGASSRDIRLEAEVQVHSRARAHGDYDRSTPLGDLYDHPSGGAHARHYRDAFLSAFGADADSGLASMMRAVADELPLRSVVRMMGALTPEGLDRYLDVLNGRVGADALPAHPAMP